MPMMRGTVVVFPLGAVGAVAGDTGKVSSRKKNGWLRVTIKRTGKTITIRNTSRGVIRLYDGAKVSEEAELVLLALSTVTVPKVELKSLSPLQRLEDAATAKLEENSAKSSGKTGYLLYCDEVRPAVKEELTAKLAKGEKLKATDMVRGIAARWKSEDQEVRDKWNAKAKNISGAWYDEPMETRAGTELKEEIDSMSESESDEFDIVDPPDDAYGDLTDEQQLAVRRLIGEFTKINKSTTSASL